MMIQTVFIKVDSALIRLSFIEDKREKSSRLEKRYFKSNVATSRKMIAGKTASQHFAVYLKKHASAFLVLSSVTKATLT